MNGRIVSKTESMFNDLGKFQCPVMPRDANLSADEETNPLALWVDHQKG